MISNHRNNNAWTVLFSFLCAALAGCYHSFLGTSPSLLFASAEELTCGMTLSIYTWEDKTIPDKDVPIPGINVLKYGLTAVLTERFDMEADENVWMKSNEFHSFEMRNAGHELSTATVAAVAWSNIGNASADASVDANAVFLDPMDDAPIETEPRQRSLRVKKPKNCFRSYDCKKRWMRLKQANSYLVGILDLGGRCHLCTEDDDAMGVATAALPAEGKEFTLDQITGRIGTDNTVDKPSHLVFENDVCNEIRSLKGYQSFETAEGCKIAFHCKKSNGTMGEDNAIEHIVVDNREDYNQNEGESEDDYLYAIKPKE